MRTYGPLFSLVTSDAGAPARPTPAPWRTPTSTTSSRLKDARRFLTQRVLAHLLPATEARATTEDVLFNTTSVVRRLYVRQAKGGYQNSCISVTDAQLAGLRTRKPVAIPS